MTACTAAPFLKWAGGKGKLLSAILPLFPKRVDTYYEPFIGGGAVFFAMAGQKRFRRAVISDCNPHLINCYQVVRDQLKELILRLEDHAEYATSPEYYYQVRAQLPETMNAVDQAARFIFLNRTCFNGLYRVNRQGRFNVPFGKYKNPTVVNEPRLNAASAALQNTEIKCIDFSEMSQKAKKGDGIYFDPPYVPLSPTSSFTAYNADVFNEARHQLLVEVYRKCVRKGVTSVLSNSDCEYTRQLYQGLKIGVLRVNRAINCDPSKRGPVNELLVYGEKAVSSAKVPPAKVVKTQADLDVLSYRASVTQVPARRSQMKKVARG